MVDRLFVEKKPGFDNEARALLKDARSFLGVTNLTGLRLFNRYDVEGLDAALLMQARDSVFSEPQLDDVYDELPQDEGVVFATEYLPGQFDQRADSAAQCIQLMAQCERPIVRTALVYILKGNLSDKDVETLKKHVINPVERREASLEKPETLRADYALPETVAVMEGFTGYGEAELDAGKGVYGVTDSNLNHTGIYLYSKGKIMIHLTFDYKTDEKCTTPGQYLKYHRTFQGLSTRELAEKVGIVPATLVLYENDRHPIKYSTAVALANVLGIDRNRLLDEYTAFVDYPYFSLLKKVRQDLSLTQIQMAELIGIGQTSYSGWEREIRVPRRKEYDKILAALKKLRVNVDTYLCQSASI